MDRFDNYIKKNILDISYIPGLPNSRNGISGYINFQISFDNFDKFLREIKTIDTTKPIKCIIYDEGIITTDREFLTRYNFLKQIMNMNFLEIRFRLSDSTFPVYNAIMDKLNWKHDDKTFLEMALDRCPTEIKDLRLEQARGKILLPEEKLLWQSDYVLRQLDGKVDRSVLEDTDKLKYVVRHYVDSLERQYDFSKLTSFDKVYLAYHFIKDPDKLNIRFAYEQTTRDINGVQRLNRSESNFESKPYGTYIRRRGVCEGQARLMRVLLNNWDIELDATTINGHTLQGESHAWVGINIHGKLYYCCLTKGGLMQPMSYLPNTDELYPKVYPTSSLNMAQLARVEKHIKSLKRK